MKLLKIIGTLVIVVLISLGTYSIMNGNYLNASSPFIDTALIMAVFGGLIVIAYKGIQVIWKV
jgi:hypothetical protein